ncbi:MAG: 50S ribosomal protein L22 [Candidatus Moranbacteria bacterium]|nr:50S ribosomal protein L22 [Candidatus Moranbacteria bacterium]
MKVTASLKNLRMSPRKVRLVTRSIVGMNCSQALIQLRNLVKKTSSPMEKLLQSAMANAENNFGLDKDNLFVSNIQVGGGPSLKRWLPRAQGRATLILKRTSQIDLELEERVEGKNRKSKEQMEKERVEKIKAVKKVVEKKEEVGTEEVLTEKKTSTKKAVVKDVIKKGQQQDSGFLNKVFQRKSGI